MFSSFRAPSDVAFNLFGLDIYWYGIILALAILVGFTAAYRLSKRYYGDLYSGFVLDYSPFLVIIGILGARLYYCLVNFSYYLSRPLEIFNIRQGGLSIHGMIIFGALALYLFAKLKKLSFLKLTDVYLCSALFAQSIGRWGNFFNSEAFGHPTNLAWKMFIPVSKRPLEFIGFDYFHPTFLYESLLDLFGFIILILLFRRFSKKSGLIACVYLILYSIIRIFVEHFRIDSVLNISGIPIAQIVSFVLILVGVIGIICILRRKEIDGLDRQ